MYNNWNKSKLNDQIKLVAKKMYANPSPDIIATLNTLEDLKKNQPKIFPQEERFDEQLATDKSLVHDYSNFIPAIEEFAKQDETFSFKHLNGLTERTLPKKTLLSFTHDFYNSIDREFAKYFNRIFKERHNNLRITDRNQQGYSRNYITYLNTINYAYINIYRTHTIDDFINIIHEYAHTIADQMCYRPRYGKYPFIELLPLLMQEIAYDDLIRCFDDLTGDVINSDIGITKTVLKYAKEILLQQQYLSTVSLQTERKQFVNKFAEYSNNTKAKTEKIMNITLQEKLSYVIPFLVMVELYDLYYEDTEKSLYLTKKIITMDEVDDYIKYLDSLGLHLNEHMDDYIMYQKNALKLTH